MARERNRVMRLLDLGTLSALRTQTTYHALARGVSAGAPDTLCLMSPSEPYVCLGFHRSFAELDMAEVRRRGLPVLRRQLGGGPVYLDPGQLLFQVVVHASRAPTSVERAYRLLLGPAIEAFRSLGVDASLQGVNDICVGGRKLSGTGMARIDDAVVCVGNMIFDFDHDAMAAVLALDDDARAAFAALQRRLLTTLHRELGRPVSRAEATGALVGAYERGLGTELVPGELTDVERRAVAELDETFTSAEWLEEHLTDPRPVAIRQAKVRGGASVFVARAGGDDREVCATVTVVDGRVEDLRVAAPGWSQPGDALRGVVDDLVERVVRFAAVRAS